MTLGKNSDGNGVATPRPVSGLIGIGVWIVGYALARYLDIGPASGLFIGVPIISLAVGFAILGFVRKERPLWPAMLALSMLTIPICLNWLELLKDIFEWIARL
jgi:hypothetical protein